MSEEQRQHDATPPDTVLRQLRIPFVRRATVRTAAGEEDAFLLDIGLDGVFIERHEPLERDQSVEIRFPWPGSEVPFQARCRVAWWHPEGEALSSKSLPPGAGLQFVEMSATDRSRLRALLVSYCRQQPRVRRFLRHWPEAAWRSDDPTAS